MIADRFNPLLTLSGFRNRKPSYLFFSNFLRKYLLEIYRRERAMTTKAVVELVLLMVSTRCILSRIHDDV